MTTCRGTTTMPRSSATSAGSEAVESVTTTVLPAMRRRLADHSPAFAASGLDDDVDQLRSPHDDPAYARPVDRAYDGGIGHGRGLQVALADRRRHVQPGPDLALHL